MQLHRYEDVVRCTVGRAVKEMSTEKVPSYTVSVHCQASVHCDTCSENECNISLIILKVLTEISQMWARMEFSYEEHYRTATPMLKCSDELIESLEESQV